MIRNTEDYKKSIYDLVGDEYTVLGEYINSKTKIKIRHNCKKCGNYEYEIYPNYLARGRRCPKCKGVLKKTTDEFKKEVHDLVGDEYTVLGEYINNNTNIKIRHNKCGYEWNPNPSWFLRGTRCPKCNGGHYEKTSDEFKQEVYNLVKDEYTLLEEYIDNKTKIKIKHNCEKCNNYEYEVSPSNFLQGYRCPKCSQNMTSKIEKEIVNFIKSLDIDVTENKRDLLSDNKELDIYIPSNNLAIEFDGLYWHSDKICKDKNYHLNKTNECNINNIRLIHIFEDEWNNKQEIVKSKLKYILNKSNNPKIFARKCIIKEINNSKVKNDFLNKNHIQGEDTSSIKLGLYYNNKLVSIMTFCKPRSSLGQKNNSKYKYELSRFASDINYTVIGAFSKLFSYFKNNYLNNGDIIITYADKRWSMGDVYIKNGWTHIHDSKPNYWYCKSNNIRIHRYNFRKQMLKEKFPDLYDDDLTEFQIMDKTSYRRIWDCGNMVFEYKI